METKRYGLLARVYDTREAMGRAAAEDVAATICEVLRRKPTVRMIFAAAPSQNEFLHFFAKDSRVDFSRIIAFHMDEYIGLPDGAPQRFGNFLRERLFGIAPFRAVHYMNASAGDMRAECARYAALLNEAPIDIVCLGIGENGHIAFNDPHVSRLDDPLDVKPVLLDDVCRRQQLHDGCFSNLEDVPTQAVTLTVPRLCRADHHFCIVPAKSKSTAVQRALFSAIGNDCPASALRLCPDVRFYFDTESAWQLL